MQPLYEFFNHSLARKSMDENELPRWFPDNLKYELRPYQEEAFKRYILLDKGDFAEKPQKPYHLLFNMATGSGKTLIMAGLILYLYHKGYRNFLFFVNSTNIIQKTKDNFLASNSAKYLFREKIVIEGREVKLKEVDNFEEADTENINIKFTTVQQLHIDLNNTKENSLTYEDFEDKKLVLIADEAHHLSSGTKSGDLFGSWEGTVKKLLNQNYDNVLLEFTATLDYESREIADKYKSKVIYKYDLSEYRLDKYSKEINLIRSEYDEKERILQALILNLYRQELATSHHINLKPVILFKAKRYIKESEQNKADFHRLIEDLSVSMIDRVRKTSTVGIIQKAFTYFENRGISDEEIVRRTQYNFKEENCLSANNDAEAEKNQILLNTLEDENNPIRAVFAVQKLNEGWDVLNLFDIVRLYEGRDGRAGKVGKTTISEAQLIGRGARYFPFTLNPTDDPYTRKFDDDIHNELKVLEELYYHAKEDSRYISELKKALIETGIYEDEDDLIEKQLTLKFEFKETEFYKRAPVFSNKRIPRDYSRVRSFEDLGINDKNHQYRLASGIGRVSQAFSHLEQSESDETVIKSKDVSLKEIPKHIIYSALHRQPFYNYDNLRKFFPSLTSIDEFIESENYLNRLEITFRGNSKRLSEITNLDYLMTLSGLLQKIENEIKNNSTEYEGSEFYARPVHQVFTDKTIRVNKFDERADGQEGFLREERWFPYNANYGTSEEKKFVELFARRFESLNQKFEDIYLLRNERMLAIYDKQGRRFEPDFLLFCRQREKEEMTYQVFIEPKGKHLKSFDKWKEDFLKEIRHDLKTVKIHTDSYLITAVPFYNYENENQFRDELEDVLKES